MSSRRTFLASVALYGLLAGSASVFAKDGDSDSGGDSGGDKGDASRPDRDDSDARDDKDDGKDDDGDSSDGRGSGGKEDADQIREAVRQGDAERLSVILDSVRRTFRGEVVRIRVNGQDRNLHYRIRILGPDRKLIDVRVKAEDGRIMSVEGL